MGGVGGGGEDLGTKQNKEKSCSSPLESFSSSEKLLQLWRQQQLVQQQAVDRLILKHHRLSQTSRSSSQEHENTIELVPTYTKEIKEGSSSNDCRLQR